MTSMSNYKMIWEATSTLPLTTPCIPDTCHSGRPPGITGQCISSVSPNCSPFFVSTSLSKPFFIIMQAKSPQFSLEEIVASQYSYLGALHGTHIHLNNIL